MRNKLTVFYCSSISLIMLHFAPNLPAKQTDAPKHSPVPSGSVQYELYSDKMDQTNEILLALRSTLDRSTFDLSSLLDSLNYDADEIISFTKKDIAFEQYAGVLRGVKGTLFSRSGNSIDQALLLASLLNDAGYDARIAASKLDSESAKEVLRAMKQAVQVAPAFADADQIISTLKKYDLVDPSLTDPQKANYKKYVEQEPEAKSVEFYTLVHSTSQDLISRLSEADVAIGPDLQQAELVSEARDYFWVQFRHTASDSWTDIHPVFIGDAPIESPIALSYLDGKVPENLQHRLRFQVFIERRIGNQLDVVPITAAWERPTANLVGVPLTFSNVPNGMLGEQLVGGDIEKALALSNFFLPSFGGSLADGSQLFDTRGTLIDPMVAQHGAAGLFAAERDAIASAISGLGGASSVPTLTGQWIEFTLISPGGDEQVFRRITFDRIGPSARAQGVVPANLEPTAIEDTRALLQLHTFMIANGDIPRGYVIDKALSRFEKGRPGFDALMEFEYEKKPSTAAIADVSVEWAHFLALLSALDMAGSLGDSHRNYRSGPALIVHRIGLSPSGGNVEAVDIVNNPRRAVDVSADVPRIDPTYIVQAGVWETAAEGLWISDRESFNTWRTFDGSRIDASNSDLLLPEDSEKPLGLPADIQASIDVDLANGYAVILPSEIPGTENFGWWRVHLETGETLGQIRDGRGSTLTEWISVAGVAVSGTLLGLSLLNCAESQSTYISFGCCALGNTLVTFMTFFLGLEFWGPDMGGWGLGAGVLVDGGAYYLPIDQVCDENFGT